MGNNMVILGEISWSMVTYAIPKNFEYTFMIIYW